MSFADTHAEYWVYKDHRARKICQLSFDEYLKTWHDVPCLDNYDLFRIKIAAWGNNE